MKKIEKIQISKFNNQIYLIKKPFFLKNFMPDFRKSKNNTTLLHHHKDF